MYRERVAYHDDGKNMIHQDVLEQRGADGYHVRITTTERLPNTMEAPRYSNFGYFFDDNSVYEGSYGYGDGYENYANPRQTENVLVKKHPPPQYEPVTESVPVQRHHAHYEPVVVKKHHAQYGPAAENVLVKKHPPPQYEPVNEAKRQTSAEDVNMEADDFIKRKHRALKLSKFMTMRTPR